MAARICRVCGGFDQACGGGDDFGAADIGFVASCPAVTVPNGPSCAAPTDPLPVLAACVGCVADFKTDCLDALAVPSLKAYPPECRAAPGPTPSATPTAAATPTPTLPLPSVTLALPSLTLTLPLPTATATPSPAATPAPTATPSCGDGIVVPPETCEQGVPPCDGLHTCVACALCL